jgi:hypothetical protein
MEASISAPPARGRGRPRSAAPRGKTSTVRVRMTDAEKSAFATKAATLGERPSRVHRRLVREFVSGEPDYFGSELVVLRRGCDQLSRVGNNLNQLVRLAHQGECPLPTDLTALLETVMGVVEELESTFASSVRHVAERRV